MQEITASLSENTLKLSTIEKGEFKGVAAEIDQDIVSGSKIKNIEGFSDALKSLITQITGKSLSGLVLNIVIDPYEVDFKFVAVTKSENIEEKIGELSLEGCYFSYLKIAPFVYQVIAVKKEKLDTYLEISNQTGIALKSVVPWVTLLPKFVDTNEPAIFISNLDGQQFVALSEFNGIFFSEVFEKDKSTQELQKIVEDLSVYKRKDPISRVYIYNHQNFSLDPKYEVLELEIPNSEYEESKGYEMHLLLNYMVDRNPKLLASQNNLLTMLPMPVVVESKSRALVPVAAISILLLVGLAYGGFRLYKGHDFNSNSQGVDNDQVLSDTNSVLETTPSQQPDQDQTQETSNLFRKDVTLRILNGAGIQGIAGKTQDIMEKLGYQIESIGNSDETGRDTTLLRFKPDKKQYQTLLEEDMKDFYTTEVGEDLPDDAPYDVLIVVGSDAKI